MGSYDSQYQRSAVLLNENRFTEARALLERLFAENALVQTGHLLSIAQFRTNDFILAVDTINRVIEADPNNTSFYQTKFNFFYDMHQLKALSDVDAQNFFIRFLLELHEKVIQNQTDPEFSFLLSQIYLKLNNMPRMFDALRDSLIRDGVSSERINSLDDSSLSYYMDFENKRRSILLDYPSHVVFETFAKCNAKCSFCVYPDMERQGTLMSMDLIKKIISDLQEIPLFHKFQLSPFAVNEPFLDKRMFHILDLIEASLPNANITLTSNASPINETNLRRLAKYKLDYLWLSVIDYRRDVYEDKMKLNYDRLLERLDLIHKAKSEGWFDKRIVLSRLKDDSKHDEAYVRFFKSRYPLFETCLWPYADWLGRTTNAITSTVKPIPCDHWFEFRIDANGIVQHCCMDGHSEYPWGDVNKNSVLEIYNQEKFRSLRLGKKTRLDIEPCNRCNLT